MPAWRDKKGEVFTTIACATIKNEKDEFELNKDVVWRNDAQLLGFGESDSAGCWAKFRVEPEDLTFFRGQKGEVFFWKMVESDHLEEVIHVQEKTKGPYGKLAKQLHTCGFFRAPPVWKAVGTDEQYQAFSRTRPCCVTGRFDHDEATGAERTEFAHVRRAGSSGTGYKGKYSGVPLIHEVHLLQHQKGELAAYNLFLKLKGKPPSDDVQEAKDWFNKKALENVQMWAHKALRDEFNVDSLTKIEPEKILAWAEEKGVTNILPRCYKVMDTEETQ